MRFIHLGFLVSMMCSQVLGVAIEGLVGYEPVVESFSSIKKIPSEGSLCELSGNKISLFDRFFVEEIDQNKLDGITNCLSACDELIDLTIPIELNIILSCLRWSDPGENAKVFYNLFWNRVNLMIVWFFEAIKLDIFTDVLKEKSQGYLDNLIRIRTKYKPLGVGIFDRVTNDDKRIKDSFALETEISDLLFSKKETLEQSAHTLDVKMPKFACKL